MASIPLTGNASVDPVDLISPLWARSGRVRNSWLIGWTICTASLREMRTFCASCPREGGHYERARGGAVTLDVLDARIIELFAAEPRVPRRAGRADHRAVRRGAAHRR